MIAANDAMGELKMRLRLRRVKVTARVRRGTLPADASTATIITP